MVTNDDDYGDDGGDNQQQQQGMSHPGFSQLSLYQRIFFCRSEFYSCTNFAMFVSFILQILHPLHLQLERNLFTHRVQPTRCDISQFIYFCKTLYMFQAVFPSIIRISKVHIEHQVSVRPLASGICQTITASCC